MDTKPLPYCLMGPVVKGFGRGSKELGIPTANISEQVLTDLPEELNAGIYFGWVNVDGKIYKMVVSIGWNPFYKNEKKSVEVHILDEFSNDLYGKVMRIMITGYIRAEKNFESVGKAVVSFHGTQMIESKFVETLITKAVILTEDLIKEIKNDIEIASKRLDEERMVALKNNTFLRGVCCE